MDTNNSKSSNCPTTKTKPVSPASPINSYKKQTPGKKSNQSTTILKYQNLHTSIPSYSSKAKHKTHDLFQIQNQNAHSIALKSTPPLPKYQNFHTSIPTPCLVPKKIKEAIFSCNKIQKHTELAIHLTSLKHSLRSMQPYNNS